jgi:hypothetical protein
VRDTAGGVGTTLMAAVLLSHYFSILSTDHIISYGTFYVTTRKEVIGLHFINPKTLVISFTKAHITFSVDY